MGKIVLCVLVLMVVAIVFPTQAQEEGYYPRAWVYIEDGCNVSFGWDVRDAESVRITFHNSRRFVYWNYDYISFEGVLEIPRSFRQNSSVEIHILHTDGTAAIGTRYIGNYCQEVSG